MTLVAFTIPDDPAALPGWLEQRLLAPDFGRFVAELSAVCAPRGRTHVPARQLLGDWYRKALSDGLKGIPAGVLQQLLRHPKCLLELQEAVLTEGGPYWDEVASGEEITPALDRGKAALEAMFVAAPPALAIPRHEPGELRSSPPAHARGSLADQLPRPTRSYFTWAVVSTALAACLLVAVGVL